MPGERAAYLQGLERPYQRALVLLQDLSLLPKQALRLGHNGVSPATLWSQAGAEQEWVCDPTHASSTAHSIQSARLRPQATDQLCFSERHREIVDRQSAYEAQACCPPPV